MTVPIARDRLEAFARKLAEYKRREARKLQSQRGYYDDNGVRQGGLIAFVRHFWHVLEPERQLVEGWPLNALCIHFEAVAFGECNRLLVNVPPGFMKSLLLNVFFPAWIWGPLNRPYARFLAFSYSSNLTERDNGKFRDLITSTQYLDLWSNVFTVRNIGIQKVDNNKTGWKMASSVGGTTTGNRADFVLADDLHAVNDAESETVRISTVRWFVESMSNRLNDLDESCIIVLGQRVHEGDVSGEIISNPNMGYMHLMIPWEYDEGRHCETDFWEDPRTVDRSPAWPERFSEAAMAVFRVRPFMWASQYQQSPEPRGGGILKRDYWQVWDKEDFPEFEYIVASVDPAYTKDKENDPSACTVWGLFREGLYSYPKVMLIWAWREFLELHGQTIAKLVGETEQRWFHRVKDKLGLVEWLAYTCERFKVDRLLIEAKASGISVSQELQRLHAHKMWGIQLVDPKGDKVARAHAVEPSFAQKIIYAPDREWADMVIDESASFPKGRYDDLTDSATQALKYLRDAGLIAHAHEVEAADYESRLHRGQQRALYDA